MSSCFSLHYEAMANTLKTRQSTTHIAPFGVRMQPELKLQLEEAARASGRSLNSEIVARLERSLSPVSPEEGVLAAIRSLMEYGKKFDTDVSVNMSKPPEKILATAIKNGNLPADATLADLSDPTAALERLAQTKSTSEGSSDSEDPLPTKRVAHTPQKKIQKG